MPHKDADIVAMNRNRILANRVDFDGANRPTLASLAVTESTAVYPGQRCEKNDPGRGA